jgi:hypothetical protein
MISAESQRADEGVLAVAERGIFFHLYGPIDPQGSPPWDIVLVDRVEIVLGRHGPRRGTAIPHHDAGLIKSR